MVTPIRTSAPPRGIAGSDPAPRPAGPGTDSAGPSRAAGPRVTIVAMGGQGDVRPYVALGLGLRAAGFRVRVATNAELADLVRSSGLELREVEADRPDTLRPEVVRDRLERSRGLLQFWHTVNQLAAPNMRRVVRECWDACRDADLVVGGGIGILVARHVAERVGVPLIRATVFPSIPTRAYRFGATPTPGPASFGAGNLATHLVARQLVWLLLRPWTNTVRREILGLPPLSLREPFGTLFGEPTLLLHGYSTAIFPRPADWDARVRVTGFWFLDRRPDWQPPAELLRFLAAGPPPVYVGFGSVTPRDARRLTDVVVGALERSGQRGILAAGWGDLGCGVDRDTVFVADALPHDWLFPRVAAVVHHGGAGTTAAGLRAGRPSVLVPHLGDQPFWADRVHQLGAGPRPIPYRQLAVERLAAAVRAATSDPAMSRRAAAIGAQIRAEDGVARAVEAFGHFADRVTR